MLRRTALTGILLACSLICASLIGLSFETLQRGLDRLVDDGSADFFSREVHLRFRIVVGIYGLAFLGAALASFRRASMIRHDPENVPMNPRTRSPLPAFHRPFWIAVFVCSLLATGVRLIHLDQPMRYDEAYTYNTYISRGILAAVSTYESPNNHLLNTLFSWGAVTAFGNSPSSLRLPALLAGILCVAASMMLANRIAGIRAAILAGFLIALSSPLIEYSTNARGYTLLSLFTILAWLSAIDLIRHDRRGFRWILAVSIGCGIATIPLMLFPLLMLGTWIGCLSWKSRDRVGIAHRILPSLLGGGTIAFVLYSPILIVTGPAEFLSNASGQKLGPPRPSSGNIHESIEQACELLFRDIPWPILACLVVGVIAFCWRLTPLFRFGRVAALVSVVACFLPLIFLNSQPPPRVWLFLLPLFFIACSCGGTWFIEAIEARIIRNGVTFILAAILAVWPFIITTIRDSIRYSAETGAFPDAELILNDLRPLLTDSDRIYAVGPAHAQLVYYGERMGIDRHQFPNVGEGGIPKGSLVILPNESGGTLDELLQKLSPSLRREEINFFREHTHWAIFRTQNAQ
ncbi:MAG TPA: glycosyltransferase family 39 protein [Planctomycetaceae bacterium]|nr:glycosyltransferase family 39 protein [Planctomycetaceae bacterium]